MITQKIIARTDSLKLDKIISRYGEDSMRQVVFIIVRPDPESDELIPITIPEDAVGSFRILKPSGNFVIVPMSKSVLSSGETAFDVVLPASATTAKGSGYYDIRITSDTDKYYYTAQGDFLIDDNIISDDVLEDVSEVNGLVFPDDFLTIEDAGAVIDDTTTSTESTWSSSKINTEIGDQIAEAIADIPIPEVSDDYVLDEEKKIGTWLGKDLYRNVVVSQGAWGGGTKTLWSLSGAHLVKWDVLIQNPYWTGTWIIPNGDNSGSLKFWAYGESTNGDSLLCDNLGGYTVSKIYAIVYYTKESW